jgi:hypothetical protein
MNTAQFCERTAPAACTRGAPDPPPPVPILLCGLQSLVGGGAFLAASMVAVSTADSSAPSAQASAVLLAPLATGGAQQPGHRTASQAGPTLITPPLPGCACLAACHHLAGLCALDGPECHVPAVHHQSPQHCSPQVRSQHPPAPDRITDTCWLNVVWAVPGWQQPQRWGRCLAAAGLVPHLTRGSGPSTAAE